MQSHAIQNKPGMWLFVVMGVCLWAARAVAADVESQLVISTPTPNVYVGDQILIDVEATAIDEDIDFDALWRDLTLQRQTYGKRIAVVKGKVVEIRIWRFEATATQPGTVVLGPLMVNEVMSNSITTSIQEAPEIRWSPTPEDISLSVEWSKSRAYVQEQLVVTIRIQHLHPINKLNIDVPDFSGFRTIELIKDRRTQADTVKGRVSTFIKRYALFAQSSGNITIPAIKVTGQIIKSRLERAPFNLSSDVTTLDIRPAPTANKKRWWLPALDVQAFDEWEKDKRWLAAGEQVRRSAIIEASGVSADQLPDISMSEVRGLRFTFIDSQRDTQIHDNGVSARAVFNFNVRALSPVPVFPDPVAVHWWNTRDDMAQTAYIRSGRIDIGAPSRDALLEMVKNDRSFFDRVAQYKTVLWLATLALLCLTTILHWPAIRARLRQWNYAIQRIIRCRFADRALHRASRVSDQQFLQALADWQKKTGFRANHEDVHLTAYLRSVYSKNHQTDAIISRPNVQRNGLPELARRLIQQRRATPSVASALN